jgi:predicted DNA-binding transcriptional regulator AlpA
MPGSQFSELLNAYEDHKTLTDQDVADISGVSVQTIRRWRYQGRGPRFLRIGQTARYLKADVAAWLQSLYCGCGAVAAD